MSLERGLSLRVMPLLPRYRSVSASMLSPGRFPTLRSRSQPSQRIMYIQGNVSKYIAHSRPAHSPSPQRVIVLNTSKKTKSLTRISRSGSHNDIHASHLYSTMECFSEEAQRHPTLEADARATSCGDIYHKGPFYPDATQSESGVSVGCSEDGSFLGTEDDNASQFSYGSSSAFHEMTIDSELDRLDSEDGLKSPGDPNSWPRFGDLRSPDSNRSSPFSYTEARKRELMSSPSWEFEKTQSRYNSLRVLIPAPDGSLSKDRLARKNSGGSSTPLAQSTPQASPRSFAGPKLSIKGCWNVDDPYDEGVSYNDSQTSKTVDESSCYSSFSEDNLSDVSPTKHDKISPRKVKLTKKSSDLPTKRSTVGGKPAFLERNQFEENLVSEESLEDIQIPPLESVIGELERAPGVPIDKEGNQSWWAVFNIGSANARREEGEDERDAASPDQDSKQKIKIVKPKETGIPLISAGKHGQEKLGRRSQSSPPVGGSVLSPKSSSPSVSDQSDGSETDDDKADGRTVEPLIKRGCREYAEDVLKKVSQNINVSNRGAFDVVRTSIPEPDNDQASADNEITVEEIITQNQGAQPVQVEQKVSTNSQSSPPYVPLQFTLSFSLSVTKEEKNEDVDKRQQAKDTVIQSFTSQPLQITPQQTILCNSSVRLESSSSCSEPTDQSLVEHGEGQSRVRDDDDNEGDESDRRTKEAHNRHYALDNTDESRGQEEEASAIFSPLHMPGEGNPQVVESRIAEVGGSGGNSEVGCTWIPEARALTPHTPGKGEDDNSSAFSYSSGVETPVHLADGFSLEENGVNAVHSTDYPGGKEIDTLCSEFTTILKFSDPKEAVVQGENKTVEDGDNVPTDNQSEKVNPAPFSFAINFQKVIKKGDDQDSKGENAKDDLTTSDRVLLTSAVVQGDSAANEQFEILSGNVRLEESKQTEPSSPEALVKSSLDPEHQEPDSTMEWRFIDPRAERTTGKSQEEVRIENVGELGDGLTSPRFVTVLATAQLPATCADDETQDVNQRWLDSRRDTRFLQDDDSRHVRGDSHQQYNNNDDDKQYSRLPEALSSDHQYQSADTNSAFLYQNDDAVHNASLGDNIKPGRGNLGSEYSGNNIDVDGSINYPSFEGNLSGDKGIPQFEKSASQNGSKDGERLWSGGEHEFLSHSAGGPATESRADTEGGSTLSQQVKRIHRKTVEETVTIEHSSCTQSKSSHPASDRHYEENENRVEFVRNRKETVTREVDEDIFTTTTTGPVVCVSCVSVPSRITENVSSGELSFNADTENPPPVGDFHHSAAHVTQNQKDSAFDSDCPPPLPSSPPPQPAIIVDTPFTHSVVLPSFATASADRCNPELEDLHASVMRWRDGVLTNNTTTPHDATQFDPPLDPTIDVQDNSMVIEVERGMKPAGPLPHHAVLDHLQAQLSQISEGGSSGGGGGGFDPSSTPSHPYNIYHDHGKATTHVFGFQGEAIHNANNVDQATNGLEPSLCATSNANTERGIPDAEIYDNDYDYVTFDQTNGAQQPSRQHQLPKSGQLKASSLWTLKEETDSLLEALSPVSSPKRNFSSTAPIEEGTEESSCNNNIHEKKDAHYESEYQKFTPLLQTFPSAFEQRKYGSESSDFDESDGNYSSISTAESSSFRSSSYGREQTPLSDSDVGVPGDLGVDKLDYRDQTSRSPGQTIGGLSSFNDFVNGLENDLLTSHWATESHASPANNASNQPTPVNFGESMDNTPLTFKSSLAFCVSAPPPQTLDDGDQEMSIETTDESKFVASLFQPPTNIPLITSTSHAKLPSPFASRSGRVPPFPVEEDSLNTSSTSSTHMLTDDAHSDASSRLYALDLDLSRISSCPSPTPSDISDGSLFTCKGTAEIKRGHSVSFEDDYDMLPTSALSHIPTSTPKPLKSVLKKTTKVELVQSQPRDSYYETWVKQFDKILDDFNIKTSPLGVGSDVMVQEDARSNLAGLSPSQGPHFRDMYKAFTNDDVEKKQNHLCPVVEDDNMGTFRFKRFLKKSHHKRSKGRRLVSFLSRLGCVSESVHSPDLSATRKRARLDNGQSYSTDFMPPLPDRLHQPVTATSLSFEHSNALSQHTKGSPSSSNHSLDSSPSRTDSAYSSVSESLSGVLNSPRGSRYSTRLTTSSFSHPDTSDHFYPDSAHSSTSDYSSLRPDSESMDPFSPRPVDGKYSRDVMTAFSDVFDQLDVCEDKTKGTGTKDDPIKSSIPLEQTTPVVRDDDDLEPDTCDSQPRMNLKDWDPSKLISNLYDIKLMDEVVEDISHQFVSMEGLMEKLPMNKKKATLLKTWKRRFFKAQDGWLYYYESSNRDRPSETIQLMGGAIHDLGNRILGIDDGRGRYLMVRCPTDKEYGQWKVALESQTADNTKATYVQAVLMSHRNSTKNVLIVDLGSSAIRAGILGERASLPQLFFPSVVAVDKKTGQVIATGLEALKPENRQAHNIVMPIRPSNKVDQTIIQPFNIEGQYMKSVFEKIFSELQINPENFWVMLSTPQNLADPLKKGLMECLVDTMNVQGVCMVQQSLLALHSYNTTSGIIVDIGNRIEILPIFEGFVIEGGVSRCPYGGQKVQESLTTSLLGNNYKMTSRTEQWLVRYIMEQSCYAATVYAQEEEFCMNQPQTIRSTVNLEPFDLPEGSYQKVSHDLSRFKSPEGFFNADLWEMDYPSLQKLIHKAIQTCPMDNRRHMWRAVFLSGGVTMLPGFAERLEGELIKLAPPGVPVEVHAAPQRYHAAYVGACSIALMPQFVKMAISKDEWKKDKVRAFIKWQAPKA